MHSFKAEAEEKIESYITLLEAEISSQGRDKKLLEYKAIFAKSFFNVAEKPITPENNEIYKQLNKLEGEISGFKTTIQNMEKVIADLRLQIQHNQRTIQTLEAKIKEKDTSLADYEAYIRVKKRQNME